VSDDQEQLLAEYARCLRQLRRLGTQTESAEADDLRDALDAIWSRMTPDTQRRVR
jgi:hypothetical protein